MQFWSNGLAVNFLWLTVLLGVAGSLARISPLSRLNLPVSILAGFLGLGLGPSGLGLLPLDLEAMEVVVYHGLALVFIAVSLQEPEPGEKTAEARSFAFAIASMNTLQALIGLSFVLLWTSVVRSLHPGFGLMLPLGFQQGPGQALSLGTAWEAGGMTDGGAIGLIIAASGFIHCVILGVPLILLGKKRGWLAPETYKDPEPKSAASTTDSQAGGLEPLTRQLAAIGICYAITFLFLQTVTPLVSPQDAAMLWGFHFIIGTLFAMGGRNLLRLAPVASPLDRTLLGRIASVVVDLTTAAAIAAISIDVLAQWAVPILVLTTIGGLFTVTVCLWAASRIFPVAPFEHALVLFGSSTGTVPTGLALLRTIDPQLRSPAPRTTVLGSSMALILAAPLLLVVIKMPIAGWPGSYPAAVFQTIGVLLAYQAALFVGWRFFAPLQIGSPTRLWVAGKDA